MVTPFVGRGSETPTSTRLKESTAVHLQFVRQYAPHLCIAGPSWFRSLEEMETLQYASRLYGSTPPICTAVLLRDYWGLGSPESS